MGRGVFAKAFSEHRKNGGTLTRKEFGEQFRNEYVKPAKEKPVEEVQEVEDKAE